MNDTKAVDRHCPEHGTFEVTVKWGSDATFAKHPCPTCGRKCGRPRIETGNEFPMTQLPSTWPQTSFFGGVHPSQANELREHLRKHGVNAEVLPSGDVKFTSRGQRRAYLRARGMVDLDGGYSD